jgi:hypothetical protein
MIWSASLLLIVIAMALIWFRDPKDPKHLQYPNLIYLFRGGLVVVALSTLYILAMTIENINFANMLFAQGWLNTGIIMMLVAEMVASRRMDRLLRNED